MDEPKIFPPTHDNPLAQGSLHPPITPEFEKAWYCAVDEDLIIPDYAYKYPGYFERQNELHRHDRDPTNLL